MSATTTIETEAQPAQAADPHLFYREFPGDEIERCTEQLQAIAKVNRVGVADQRVNAGLLMAALNAAGRLYNDLFTTAERWGILSPEDPVIP